MDVQPGKAIIIMNNMFDEIVNQINNRCLFIANQPICVGVSGGPDSICLLDLLMYMGYPLIVAHFNHHLRSEAELEEKKVYQFAKDRSMPVFIGKGDVLGYAKGKGLSIEDAARTLRYQFLFNIAKDQGAQAVAVGHTAEDQVETFLLHLLRGAGLDGLCGMRYRNLPNAWSDEIPLVRPLLSIWRDQVMQYVTENNLPYFADRTNLDENYRRNWVRHKLLPILGSFNPKVKTNIWQTTAILQSEKDVLDDYVNLSWNECLADQGSGYIKFNQAKLASLPTGLQSQLMRKAINLIKPSLNTVDYAAINRVRACLYGHKGTRGCDVVSGIRFSVDNDGCWFYFENLKPIDPTAPQMKSINIVDIKIPGQVNIGGAWNISIKIEEENLVDRDKIYHNLDPFKVWIDREQVHGPLIIRTRRGGDKIKPLGLAQHSVKISDLMINKKMPANLRTAWPLICNGDEVVWIPGYFLSENYKVTEKSKILISLELSQKIGEGNLTS